MSRKMRDGAPVLFRVPRRLHFGWVLPAALLLPNLCFLGVHFVARRTPEQAIREHIRLAFNRGDLQSDTKEFVFLDSARGVEPWGDANTMRMVIQRSSSVWLDALAPRLRRPADGVERHPAEELRGAVFGDLSFDPDAAQVLAGVTRPRPESPATFRQYGYYHRYWHGNVAVTAFLLSCLDVRQARLVLMQMSYFLFMLLPLAAAGVSRRLAVCIAIISTFGIWFSSLPYHGQTFAYAPAFIWSQAVALPVFWLACKKALSEWIVPLGLVLGAVAAFVEPMSGGFVLGGGLFFLACYFAKPDGDSKRAWLLRAGLGSAAFVFGVAFSVLFKQTLAALVFGWADTIEPFVHQLRFRIGLAGGNISYAKMTWAVGQNLVYLTFGSRSLALILVFGSASAFLVGGALAVADIARRRPGPRLPDYLAILAVIMAHALWFFALPSHNTIHAWITVRLLYVPLSLCWVLLWITVSSVRGRDV